MGGARGWLRWPAHPLGGAVCRDHAQDPAFASGTSEMAGGFWPVCIFVLFAPAALHAVIFSPLLFLCVRLLQEMFVLGQALQQRVPGPSLSHRQLGSDLSCNLMACASCLCPDFAPPRLSLGLTLYTILVPVDLASTLFLV